MFHRVKKIWRGLLACSLGLTLIGSAYAGSDDWLNIGPIFDQFDLTLTQGHRTEIGGPVFYSQTQEDDKLWAIPPFFSMDKNSGTDSEEWDFFYPVMTYDRFGSEHRWQLFQLFNISGGDSTRSGACSRFR